VTGTMAARIGGSDMLLSSRCPDSAGRSAAKNGKPPLGGQHAPNGQHTTHVLE
jgi:hypothetical protein